MADEQTNNEDRTCHDIHIQTLFKIILGISLPAFTQIMNNESNWNTIDDSLI